MLNNEGGFGGRVVVTSVAALGFSQLWDAEMCYWCLWEGLEGRSSVCVWDMKLQHPCILLGLSWLLPLAVLMATSSLGSRIKALLWGNPGTLLLLLNHQLEGHWGGLPGTWEELQDIQCLSGDCCFRRLWGSVVFVFIYCSTPVFPATMAFFMTGSLDSDL